MHPTNPGETVYPGGTEIDLDDVIPPYKQSDQIDHVVSGYGSESVDIDKRPLITPLHDMQREDFCKQDLDSDVPRQASSPHLGHRRIYALPPANPSPLKRREGSVPLVSPSTAVRSHGIHRLG